ncbi:hypothetical protein FBU30_007607 [Linnemannia zychae]|nr:hypothetical protein FBU30_007607 [Linnemannia zychae]
MARKVFHHSILAALFVVTVCFAAPSSFIPTIPGDLDSTPINVMDPSNLVANLGALGSDLNNVFDPANTTGNLADSSLNPPDINLGLDSLAMPTLAPSSATVVPSQTVQLASETDVVPITGVYPNLIFQPAIQLYDPLINDFQTFGTGPIYTNGYADFGRSSSTLLKKRQLPPQNGPLDSLLRPGIAFEAGYGPDLIGRHPMNPPTIVNSDPVDVSTDTLIQPIVNIQPHALEPVPVPVSTLYNYPVPVGVSVPLGGWRGSHWGDNSWECNW